jgi:hypothetical protein
MDFGRHCGGSYSSTTEGRRANYALIAEVKDQWFSPTDKDVGSGLGTSWQAMLGCPWVVSSLLAGTGREAVHAAVVSCVLLERTSLSFEREPCFAANEKPVWAIRATKRLKQVS